jgi:hypothetical protein
VSRTAQAQHLFDLGLYLVAMGLLFYLYAGTWLRPASAASLLPPLLFALHPVNAEIYMWMGGLNDVLCGMALIALALLLRRRLYRPEAAPSFGVDALLHTFVLLGGMLCKEPFFVAALFMIVAHLASDRAVQPGEPDLRERMKRLAPALLALGLSLALALTFRMLASGGASSRGPRDIVRSLRIVARIPRVVAMAVETLLVPLARPVRHLSWELSQPWSPTLVLGCLLALALLGWVAYGRRFRALILILGAGATLAPATIIADFFWPGFDRYLFIPTVLLLTAWLPPRAQPATPLPAVLQREPWATLLAGGLLVWLVFCDQRAARFFHSDADFAASMMIGRPDDPTGYLIALANTPEAQISDAQRAYLAMQSTRDLPVPISQKVALLAFQNGLYREAASSIEHAYRLAPDDPWIRFSLLELRGAQHRFDEALQQADRLLRDGSMCRSTAAKLHDWLDSPQLETAVRARVLALLAARACE